MSEEPPRRKRRSTATRGKLRRGNNVESVRVEENFSLSLPGNTPESLRSELAGQNGLHAGDGCYVSATVHNNRYYGVLVEQSALKAASLLHFRDEASSLDLNSRMKMLQGDSQADEKKESSDSADAGGTEHATDDHKRPADGSVEEEPSLKRVKLEMTSEAPVKPSEAAVGHQAIQKFRYVDGDGTVPGYRILLATYADVEAASEDDDEKAQKIQAACQAGGGFVGQYYYQCEVGSTSLETSKLNKPTDIGMRTSLGFEKFLNLTGLPTWFPLRNLQTGQSKVLSMLKMKKGKGDTVVFDESAETLEIDGTGTLLPMEPRSRYRVGILGAGIAGLACATELLQQAQRENVDLEVVLLEGRSRVGGRLLTDDTTFKCTDGETPFPVDLGASWIHGIDDNPLAALAKEAGVSFVTSSEEVKMLRENMGHVDRVVDERIGDLFDDLLDQAAEDCWEQEDYLPDEQRSQKAVRWYASVLGPGSSQDKAAAASSSDAPPHRSSSDVSIDHAMGKVIAKNNQKKFSKMTKIEQNLLMWNILNINYALGANISDLSMKFWDSDDRHAFEGDHVLLKEGYSQIVRHMMNGLETNGDKFRLVQNCPIAKVEYARRSTTLPYPDNASRRRKMLDLSDTCCVTSRDDQSFKFDLLVSTLPLGVLKDSIESDSSSDETSSSRVSFQPSLPFTKRDSIASVGFGLLNKVYLQFPRAFWRIASVLSEDGQILFGNASGVNPEHYMFYDIGKSLGNENNAPAILMTLISGKEAAASEQLSDEDLVNRVLQTLRVLFSNDTVPEPLASTTTRWGGDEFARGCYTFLPPGTSDQDFGILQSPINGNGDSLVLDGSETMRLFWAGEHTTSLHPSMAHGAMLSGIRAAREVISTLQFRHLEGQEAIDKLIPLAIFRKRNPSMTLRCNLCDLYGSRAKEGSLLAFQRGARQVLAHNNCAEWSPEVEVADGKWKNVIKAVNRGKQIECILCGRNGATVGCTQPNCFKCFHFSCAEETGWRFERDDKVFYCDMHRSKKRTTDRSECDQVSLRFFRSRFPSSPLICQLCGVEGDDKRSGAILIFQQRNQYVVMHEKCARFTTLVETVEENDEGDDKFRNLLEAATLAKLCEKCKSHGASIGCSESACPSHFHYACAEESGWNFPKGGKQFRCEHHRDGGIGKSTRGAVLPTNDVPPATVATTNGGRTVEGAPTAITTDGGNTSDSAAHPNGKLVANGTAAPHSGSTATPGAATTATPDVATNGTASAADSGIFQHNLFCHGSNTVMSGGGGTSGASHSQPSNANINGLVLPNENMDPARNAIVSNTLDSSSEDAMSSEDEEEVDVMLQSLSGDALPASDRSAVAVTVQRTSLFDPWNFSFGVTKGTAPGEASALSIEVGEGAVGLEDGDIVTAINGTSLGSVGASNLREILSVMRDASTLEVTVLRLPKKEAATTGEAIGSSTSEADAMMDAVATTNPDGTTRNEAESMTEADTAMSEAVVTTTDPDGVTRNEADTTTEAETMMAEGAATTTAPGVSITNESVSTTLAGTSTVEAAATSSAPPCAPATNDTDVTTEVDAMMTEAVTTKEATESDNQE